MDRLHSALTGLSGDEFEFHLRVIAPAPEGSPARSGGPKTGWAFDRFNFVRWQLRRGWRHYLLGRPSALATSADLLTGMKHEIEESGYDLVNLHWLGNRTISIGEIGRLKIPTIFTLHDMWPLLDTEHYDDSLPRREPSFRERRLIRRVNRLKDKHFRWSFFVSPSRWMKAQALYSPRADSTRVQHIPNPVDIDFWCPKGPLNSSREVLKKRGHYSISFGYSGTSARWRKGADLAYETLVKFADAARHTNKSAMLHLTLFGDAKWDDSVVVPSNVVVKEAGRVDDDGLREVLRQSDALLLTSRIDNLPQIGTEAQSCGVPVFGFQVGGMGDVVEHGLTGVLVEAFDADALSHALHETFSAPEALKAYGVEARARACRLWRPEIVAQQYLELFRSAVHFERFKP